MGGVRGGATSAIPTVSLLDKFDYSWKSEKSRPTFDQ